MFLRNVSNVLGRRQRSCVHGITKNCKQFPLLPEARTEESKGIFIEYFEIFHAVSQYFLRNAAKLELDAITNKYSI
jgi:hypothetical protein